MSSIFVTKYNGSLEEYDREKVIRSILAAGIGKEDVLKVLSQVEEKLYDKIPTVELYRLVNQELESASFNEDRHLYRLRERLSEMDSIDFEKFVASLLENEGYKTKWNTIAEGKCVEHQIDVIAQKNDEIYFVEVKHHRNQHRECGLGTIIELWGRLDDLRDGFGKGLSKYDFTNAWLFCNNKFSEHARRYAQAKNLLLTGWKYSNFGTNLEKLVEKKGAGEVSKLMTKLKSERQWAESRFREEVKEDV